MWEIVFAEDDRGVPVGKNRFESLRLKRPEEFRIMLSRAQNIATALESGCPISDIYARGWVHVEKSGVIALDPGRLALRLYCCLDSSRKKVILLTAGDKKKQGADILECARWAKELLGKV